MFDPKGWKFVKNQRGNSEHHHHHPLNVVIHKGEEKSCLSCVEKQVQ